MKRTGKKGLCLWNAEEEEESNNNNNNKKDFICKNCWQNQQIKLTNGKYAHFPFTGIICWFCQQFMQMKYLHILHLQTLFVGSVNSSCIYKIYTFSIYRHYLLVLSTVLQMKYLHIFHLQALFTGSVNSSCKQKMYTFSIDRHYLLVLFTVCANRICFCFFFLHFPFAGFICWLCQQFLQMKS